MLSVACTVNTGTSPSMHVAEPKAPSMSRRRSHAPFRNHDIERPPVYRTPASRSCNYTAFHDPPGGPDSLIRQGNTRTTVFESVEMNAKHEQRMWSICSGIRPGPAISCQPKPYSRVGPPDSRNGSLGTGVRSLVNDVVDKPYRACISELDVCGGPASRIIRCIRSRDWWQRVCRESRR